MSDIIHYMVIHKILPDRKKRALRIASALKDIFPDALCTLHYNTDWELLVAVVLSAQCSDKKVNEVTARLFKKYRGLNDYLKVGPAQFASDIKPTGFYHTKTKNILATARIIKEKFGGSVPCEMSELVSLPGIGRKSANVIQSILCGKIQGIAVDTHVRRFAYKFDLSDSRNPVVIERDLMNLLPKPMWRDITMRMIQYGRNICPARKHNCDEHPLTVIYPKATHRWPKAR
jgi:endonuclease III